MGAIFFFFEALMKPELLLDDGTPFPGPEASCSMGFLPVSLYLMKSEAKLVTAAEEPRYSDRYSLISPADCRDIQNCMRVMSPEPFNRLRQAAHHSRISAPISLPPNELFSALVGLLLLTAACCCCGDAFCWRGGERDSLVMPGPVLGAERVGGAGVGAARRGAMGLSLKPRMEAALAADTVEWPLLEAFDAHDIGCFLLE